MMQKRKNIRLLIILAVLVIITVATYLLLMQDRQAVLQDPAMFAVEDVSEIDSVVLIDDEEIKTLHFENNSWLVNDAYDADPQKLTVLFAILNQVRAKRPVAEAREEQVDSLFRAEGTEVKFYKDDELVRQFEVAGIPENGITYFRGDEGTFIVNIPGYRSYLASLFNMSTSDWRNKLIFDDVSWNNLEQVDVDFPASGKTGFTIVPEQGYYSVERLAATDSVKLLDYLDRVSLLLASEYLKEENVNNADSLKAAEPLINIAVTDIRNRPFTLSIFPRREGRQGHVALQDSVQWLSIERSQVDPLLRDRQYFQRGE